MQINNLSLVVGAAVCNGACPYCISKMTGIKMVGKKEKHINWHNFRKTCRLAQIHQVDTVMLTGKGEPTLFPGQITQYLDGLLPYDFPFIEIQTNGMMIARSWKIYAPKLKSWYKKGLTTISISLVHYTKEKNREIYCPGQEYPDIKKLCNDLHALGFMIRFSCTLLKGYVDRVSEVEKMIAWTRELGVEQLTLRPVVTTTDKGESKEVYTYTKKHQLSPKTKKEIGKYLDSKGHRLHVSAHGAIVYDLDGQNVSYSNALTLDTKGDYVRQLIFYPEGLVMSDWQYQGTRFL